MTTLERTNVAAARLGAVQTFCLLAIGMIPGILPGYQGLAGLTTVIESIRSPELNRAERDMNAAGYYEGLIGGGDGPEGSRGELALRLMGKPAGWVRFHDAGVATMLTTDFLQFELKPNLRRSLFGKPFETNAHGIPGTDVSLAKPKGTFRIATLGSSMDMGWGVSNQEAYTSRLENWLNAHHTQRGGSVDESPDRFEVLNFAVAAYSPLQRLETYYRKVQDFQPDMVIYSSTMLDLRLMEIHICDLLRSGVDLKYDFLKKAIADAGITSTDIEVDADGKLIFKDKVKSKLQPLYWNIYDATIRNLAEKCRAAGTSLVFVIIPRVGKADAPDARAESVAHLKAIAAHSGLTVYDLSNSYDRFDPATLEIAAWDDHPNALGHHRLFLGLARTMVKDRETYELLFPPKLVKKSPLDSDSPAAISIAPDARRRY